MIAFIFKIWTFLKGKFKYILAILLAAAVALSGGVAGNKGRKLKEANAHIKVLEQQVETQQDLIARLANMETVRCEVAVTVKNTAVMGSAKSGAVELEARQIATCLRNEIIDKLLEDEKEKQSSITNKP
jgi:hypothetical protein